MDQSGIVWEKTTGDDSRDPIDDRPRIYIAAPFFNHPQQAIVSKIEGLLDRTGFPYYSPRLHSGSHLIPPEHRKDRSLWKSVLDSNIQNLYNCDLVLAVIEYAMPPGIELVPVATEPGIVRDGKHIRSMIASPKLDVKAIELPDAGVIWECGMAFAINRPVIAYHSNKSPDELNLMLSHTIQGFLSGWSSISAFFEGTKTKYFNTEVLAQYSGDVL